MTNVKNRVTILLDDGLITVHIVEDEDGMFLVTIAGEGDKALRFAIPMGIETIIVPWSDMLEMLMDSYISSRIEGVENADTCNSH